VISFGRGGSSGEGRSSDRRLAADGYGTLPYCFGPDQWGTDLNVPSAARIGCRWRLIEGKMIDPKDPPAHETFIKHALIPEPDGTITVTDCYHKYYRFCRGHGVPLPTRTEFTSIVTDAVHG